MWNASKSDDTHCGIKISTTKYPRRDFEACNVYCSNFEAAVHGVVVLDRQSL